MAVERNDDGSITIRSKNSVSTITRTVLHRDEKRKEEFQQLVEKCAKTIKPCAHSFKEVIEYFLDNCDAVPIEPGDRYLKHFLYNVVINHCKEKLETVPRDFSFEMTDEEIQEWSRAEEVLRAKIMNSSPEDYGLHIHGFYLPHTERNLLYYNEMQNLDLQTDECNKDFQQQDIHFFFEETTEQGQANGGGGSLMNELIIYRGVSEEDIKSRNLRFLGYISALRDTGKLPDLK